MIRGIQLKDKEQWEKLYKGYADFYRVEMKNKIEKNDKSVKGFNLDVNSGRVAGQTIMHVHIHLIPRRKGDIEDPRGGIRGVIPYKQKY
jgi:diadenosine tetraphosphate (Ap4A) HIT family hydrolase